MVTVHAPISSLLLTETLINKIRYLDVRKKHRCSLEKNVHVRFLTGTSVTYTNILYDPDVHFIRFETAIRSPVIKDRNLMTKYLKAI